VASWSDFVIWRSQIETSILSLAESLFLVIYNSTPPRFVNCQLASSQISIRFRHESIHVMLRDTIRVKIKLLYLFIFSMFNYADVVNQPANDSKSVCLLNQVKDIETANLLQS